MQPSPFESGSGKQKSSDVLEALGRAIHASLLWAAGLPIVALVILWGPEIAERMIRIFPAMPVALLMTVVLSILLIHLLLLPIWIGLQLLMSGFSLRGMIDRHTVRGTIAAGIGWCFLPMFYSVFTRGPLHWFSLLGLALLLLSSGSTVIFLRAGRRQASAPGC